MAARITYRDGRKAIECDSAWSAVDFLEDECEVIHKVGGRWFAWATREDAYGPDGGVIVTDTDGLKAVAEIRETN